MTGAGLLSVLSSWLICAGPLTRPLFGRYLGIVQPPDIRQLQRWNTSWARDPAYLLQFSASSEAIDGIVQRAGLRPMTAAPLLDNPLVLNGAPTWWRPVDATAARAWDKDGVLIIQLLYSADTGVAQLGFFEQ
jgi:hypothetical protein